MAKGALDLTFADYCNRQHSRNLHSAFTRTKLDYDKVKELILKAYELVPEAYR